MSHEAIGFLCVSTFRSPQSLSKLNRHKSNGSKAVNSAYAQSHIAIRPKQRSPPSFSRLPNRNALFNRKRVWTLLARMNPEVLQKVVYDGEPAYHQRGNPFRPVGEAPQALRLHIGTEQWRNPR